MSALLTVVIPFIDGDSHLAERAIQSVEAQTVPSVAIPVHDKDRRGPQWGRNKGLWQADTPFVTFLDADDWLEPTFAEKTIAAYRLNRYVYTDYYWGKGWRRLPDETPCGNHYGMVTRLVRTETARAVGGFDENMKRLEDTEFWLRVRRSGVCGIHVTEPLLTYSQGGVRSNSHDDREVLLREIKDLYGRYLMGCCGGPAPQKTNVNEKQDGDVLATPTWLGNRAFVGTASGRNYPRSSRGKGVWVDPRDLDAMNTLTKVEVQPQVKETPIDETQTVEHTAPFGLEDAEPLPSTDEINEMYRDELDKLAERMGLSTDGNKPDVRGRILEALEKARG